MPEKLFYTFLIFFIISLFGYLSASDKSTRPARWLKTMGNVSWVGMIISAICWIWG